MIKRKKAIGYGTLAGIIIVMVVFFILIGYADTFANILTKGSDIETCRLSVLAQAQTKFVGKTLTSLKCPRREVKFFNDKLEVNGKKEAKYEFKQLDSKIVNKVIAEELRLCWLMMGEGGVNVFQQDFALGYDKVCAICSEVSFDKKVDKSKQFTGLIDYLKGSKIPGQDIHYYDYLVRSQKEILLLLGGFIYTPWISYTTTSKIEEDFFQPGKEYIIYFMAFKSSWLNEKADEIFGIENSHLYYIGVGSPASAARECRRLVN